MSDGTRNIAWGQVIVTAILAPLIVGVLLYYFTWKVPDLVYEEFPPAHFTSQAAAVSIYNVAVDNFGAKEASDVRVNLTFPAGTAIQEIQVKPSSTAIDYQVLKPESTSARSLRFPLLNAGEGVRFSLLVNKGDDARLTVEVRGTGVVGRRKDKEADGLFRYVTAGFGALAASMFGLLAAWLFKVTQLQGFLQRSSSQQLRALRTQSPMQATSGAPPKKIEQLLAERSWRLFYNPSVPAKSKVMRFVANGSIVEGQNLNEARWRVQNDLLELLNDQGGVHGRFYYSPMDQSFYSTNDPDIGAITKHRLRDQYMMPEAL